MAFLTDKDYKVVIGEKQMGIITDADPEKIAHAEAEAIEELSSYLRPKYDVERIFSATVDGTADHRNRLIVMYAVDCALYHLFSASSQRMGMEIRKERYERAVKWLEGVQAGKIVPDLPLATTTDESGHEVQNLGILIAHQPPLRYNW